MSSSITPRQVNNLGTSLQRRLSFALATLTKEDAQLLGRSPYLFDEWALTWLRFRAHGVNVFVDCRPEWETAVYHVLGATPGVYTVLEHDFATLFIVDDAQRLEQVMFWGGHRVDAFFVCIGSSNASPWVLRTVAPDDIENGLSSFFKWLRDTLPDPTKE